tara:strand:- start:2268 stop:2861 length:594 start_codon:yes stop_codon:yes gene_type:complete
MASLFDQLQAGSVRAGVSPQSKESMNWFRNKVKELGDVNRRTVIKDSALKTVTNPKVGDMVMYFYDPKYKNELPYYDRFPLTILVDAVKGGFHGLNLHYLAPGVRARFLDELMSLAPKKVTDTTRLARLRYNLLQGTRKYKEFKPCYKHYLMNHVKSRIARVPMTDWQIAIFLPVEQFVKVQKTSVWRYSRKEYSGR